MMYITDIVMAVVRGISMAGIKADVMGKSKSITAITTKIAVRRSFKNDQMLSSTTLGRSVIRSSTTPSGRMRWKSFSTTFTSSPNLTILLPRRISMLSTKAGLPFWVIKLEGSA